MVYTTRTCVQCPYVKKFLKLKNIPYDEVDVTDDPMKLQELTGYSSVPVTMKEGSLPIVGYSPTELAKLV